MTTNTDTTSQVATKNVHEAIWYVQAHADPILRNATGQTGHQKYEYAPLETIMAALRPALKEAHLCVKQTCEWSEPWGWTVKTVATHAPTGESEVLSIVPMAMGRDQDSKGLGRDETYARRYGILAGFCLAPAGEDDGENDQRRNQSGQRQQQRRQAPVNGNGAGKSSAPATSNGNGAAKSSGNGTSWDEGWKSPKDYSAAKEWAEKLIGSPAVTVEWGKIFKSTQAHKAENASVFLGKWHSVVTDLANSAD